jgi:hypothetical protein
VQKSIAKVLKGEDPSTVVDEGHRAWYRKMPSRRYSRVAQRHDGEPAIATGIAISAASPLGRPA